MSFAESLVEAAALASSEALGYAILHGPAIDAGQPGAERSDPNFRDVLLERRLRQTLVILNPGLLPDALDGAYRKLTRSDAPSLVGRDRGAHRMLVDCVTVEYRRSLGSIAGAQVRRAG
jgi:type I restriction enzyme R subunit